MTWPPRTAWAIPPALVGSYGTGGEAMRTVLGYGMLGVVICAAVSYLAAGYMGRHSRCGTCCGLLPDDTASSPTEPHALDGLLPDPEKLTEDGQAFETIDLLSNPNAASALAQQNATGQHLPPDLLP